MLASAAPLLVQSLAESPVDATVPDSSTADGRGLQVGPCGAHNACATCITDKTCGWCTGGIGGGDPGSCMARTDTCDTILETAKCPDCHLPWIRFANTVRDPVPPQLDLLQ